jgi:hypothetical protein
VIGILQEEVDEYENDRDLGYEIYEFPESELKGACKEIDIKKNFPTKYDVCDVEHWHRTVRIILNNTIMLKLI